MAETLVSAHTLSERQWNVHGSVHGNTREGAGLFFVVQWLLSATARRSYTW